MLRRHLRTLVIVVIVIGVVAAAFRKPLTVGYYLHDARKFLRKRESEQAVDLLERAHRIDSQHPEVHFLLARGYRRMGKFDRVMAHLDEAEGWGWSSELVQLERLMGAAQAGQLKVSAPELYNYLARGGDYGDTGPEICEALVNGYFLSYQFGLAQPLLDEWEKAYPDDSQCYMFRGLFFENRSNPTKAVAEYRKALDLAEDRADVRLRLAQVLKKSNQFDEAIAQFTLLRQIDPGHPEVLTGLGECFRGQGRLDAAREVLEEVLQVDASYFDAQLALGQIEETAGRPEEAMRWLRPACREKPSDTEARYSLARSLQVVGRKARESAAWIDKPGTRTFSDVVGWSWRWARAELTLHEAAGHFQFVADAQMAMGRVQIWTDIISTQPRNTDLRFKIGDYLMKYDNPEHGLGWMLSVLDIDPDHVPTHRALEGYFLSKGKDDRAALHARKVKELTGDESGSGATDLKNEETGDAVNTR